MPKNSKSYHVQKAPLVDASTKSRLTVIAEDQESLMEEYKKEIERTRKSMERIRKEYIRNSAVERIRSRRLMDICRIYLDRFIEKQERQEKASLKDGISKDKNRMQASREHRLSS